MPDRIVLDSFALLAFFQEQPGAARVEEVLLSSRAQADELYLSVISLGEMAYTVERRRGLAAAQQALAFVDRSPIRLLDADRTLALMAARVKATTGMGYADCFVVASAQRMEAAIMTGDPDFQQAQHLVQVEWLPAGGAG